MTPPAPNSNRATSGLVALYADMLDRLTEQSVRWRSMALLFVAGGALALLSMLLPMAPGCEHVAVAALGLTAIAAGVGMHLGAHRLSNALMSPALALGTLLVSGGVIATNDTSAVYALFYVWVGFEAFFFLSKSAAFFHLAFISVAYATAMQIAGQAGQAAGHAGTAPEARWLMTIGTVVMIGFLAGLLNDRAERLIERLAEAARTDPLTGLLNRRGFEDRLGVELARARRTGERLSVVIGDLDHFKTVNDTFGHKAGDEALTRFARFAEDAKRQVDGFGRIGGEEFALVLPDTDEQGGFVLAERIRRGFGNGPSGLTASFGIASFPRHGTDAEPLLQSADQALYAAKQLGRNRSVIFSAEIAADVLRNRAHHDIRHVEQAAAVLVLAETLDLRDMGTAMHSHTVGRYAEMIACRLELEPEHVERIRLAGLLHDIGKVGVPDEILNKPGGLTEAEWVEMRRHPELGARILSGANLDDISAWVLAHHERLDGRGYPAGLPAEAIPLEARILAVADSYEAMTSDRVYRAALSPEEAKEELRRCAGTQFDPEIVAAFLAGLSVRAIYPPGHAAQNPSTSSPIKTNRA